VQIRRVQNGPLQIGPAEWRNNRCPRSAQLAPRPPMTLARTWQLSFWSFKMKAPSFTGPVFMILVAAIG